MLLKNCKIYLDKKIVEGEILIDDNTGKIKKIARIINNNNENIINIKNNLVIPGAIDCHVHFRWKSKKEGFKSGSLAAINGGICFAIDMPNDNPPITCKELFYKKLEDTKNLPINLFLNFGITENNYREYIEEAKVYKIFMVKSVGELYISNYDILKDIFLEPKLYCIHAEHRDVILENLKKYSYNSWESHTLIRNNKSEYLAVKEVLKNLSDNSKIHFCHISTEESLKEIEKFKDKHNISVEVCPHHLYLTKDMAEELKGFGKVNPPLRDDKDRKALIVGINRGIVDIIASDHAPHLLEEKLKDVKNCPSGIPGIETLLPLTFNLYNKKLISIDRVISLISINPAKRFNINNNIIENNIANLTIVDIKKEGKINSDLFESKAKFSPFDGLKVKGFPIYTIVKGKLYESYGLKI